MAVGIEKRELRSFEMRKQKHKQRIVIIAIVIVLIACAIGTFVIYQILNKKYTSYQVIHTIDRTDSSSAKYLSYGSGVLRYSRDGAMAMDGAGNLLWNGTYEMNDPIIDICEKYVAVSDRGYETVQLYNGEGGATTIKVNNPIIKTEVANQGVVAVLMDGKDVNHIEFYSAEGEYLAGIRTVAADDGYPIDMSLSDDGKKLVTSYISINNGTIQNKVAFYNFGEVGKNYIGNVVGGYSYKNTLIPNVQFVNNNTVCAFGDNKFAIYSMKEIPELKCEVNLQSKVKSVFHNEKYIGFVLENKKGDNKYRILTYDFEGKVKLDKTTNTDYVNISLSGDELILYSNTEWTIWRMNGEEKLKYTFGSNISYILPVDNLEKYIVIDDLKMKEVKLIEKKQVKE